MLAELHLHLYGCIRPAGLPRHLAEQENVRWDFYEADMEANYGVVPPTREIIERHRRGDADAASLFEEIFVFGDADAGNFSRFQAKFHLLLAGSSLGDPDATRSSTLASAGRR